MLAFSPPDALALALFIGAWLGYSVLLEKTARGKKSLNALMHAYREQWFDQMIGREVRIVDSQVTAALQNGTAFFASTTLIAIGGALSMLRAGDQILQVMGLLPFSVPNTQQMWEAKIVGLAVILVYAFFKFAWSYRLFNYLAIMIGAAPPPAERQTPAARRFIYRAARLCEEAGLHFNRGQRAFFFALGYLGWFLGPFVFAFSTIAVLIVMWRRQFASASRRAFDTEVGDAS
ncbi:MAG: DUF599 domain-containing protein [Proteobacteria bacterium]|nr:DUF599 domain-containing protein [Pseudomonadota bacterium]